jgi:hypothetical protein
MSEPDAANSSPSNIDHVDADLRLAEVAARLSERLDLVEDALEEALAQNRKLRRMLELTADGVGP